jgi:hypothetical protein
MIDAILVPTRRRVTPRAYRQPTRVSIAIDRFRAR